MKCKRENKGFSLVEVIVVIAIFAVVGTVVGSFMLAASRSYATNANELNLQEEAQLVANQLQEMILDTAYGISYKYVVTDDTGNDLIDYMENDAAVLPTGNLTQKDLYIYGNGQYYHLFWDKENAKLYLEEYEKNSSGNYVLVAGMPSGGVLFGEFISEFQVDLSKVASDRMVGFNIRFKKPGSERDYLVARTVSLRNDVMTNVTSVDVDKVIAESFPPAADSLTVTPSGEISMWPGDMQQYRTVLGCSKGGVPNQMVSWTVESTDGVTLSPSTKMSMSNVLQVGADEKSKRLVLNVSANGYDYDNNIEITLTHAPLYVNIREITKLEVTNHNFGETLEPGGKYEVSVMLVGNELPATVADAGGISAYAKTGNEYIKITEKATSGLTATYRVEVSNKAPEGMQFELVFGAKREGFTDKVATLKTPAVKNVTGEILKIDPDRDSSDWLRLGKRKVTVKFKEGVNGSIYMDEDEENTLDSNYYIKYIYKFYDFNGYKEKTATSTVGAVATSGKETYAGYLTSVEHKNSFEAEATMSDQVPLTSGKVVVSAELWRITDGDPELRGTSNEVEYAVPQATLAYRQANKATPKSSFTAYIAPSYSKIDSQYNDVPCLDNNKVTVYVSYGDGFEEGTNPTIDLEKFNIISGSDYVSEYNLKKDINAIEIIGTSDSSKYNGKKSIKVEHKELKSSFNVSLVEENISSSVTSTYLLYVPYDTTKWEKFNKSEWTQLNQDYVKDCDYIYFIDDHRIVTIDKFTSWQSTKYKLYIHIEKDMQWNYRRAYTYSTYDKDWR